MNTPEDIARVVVTSQAGRGPRTILVETMTPFAQALVRAARTFMQSWVGFILLGLASWPVLGAAGIAVPPQDFLAVLKTSAGLALAPTVISLLQNLIEIFAKLDEMFPKLRA